MRKGLFESAVLVAISRSLLSACGFDAHTTISGKDPLPDDRSSSMVVVTGSVRGSSGVPVPEVRIIAAPRGEVSQSGSDVGFVSAEDGSYGIPLFPGIWDVHGERDGVETEVELVHLEEDDVEVDLHFPA